MLINDVMVNKVIFQICLSKKGAELVTDGGDGDWRISLSSSSSKVLEAALTRTAVTGREAPV